MATGAVIAIKDGKVLLLKRGEDAPWMPGKWDFPGGGIEEGEDPKEAAAREAKEEIGLETRTLHELTVVEVEDEPVHFFYSHWFKPGDLELGSEHDDYKWVSIKEATRMDVVPGILRALHVLAATQR
jgi:mutator protein MutT